LLKTTHALLTLLIATVLARTLGPESFGIYTFAIALVMLLSIPAQAGIPILLVRETAKASADNNNSLEISAWRWSVNMILLFSTGVTAAYAISLWSLWSHLGEELRITLAFGSPLIVLLSVSAIQGARLRGRQRVLVGQLPDHLLRLAAFLLLLLAWISLIARISPSTAISMHVLAGMASVALACFPLRKLTVPSSPSAKKYSGRSKEWTASILPLAAMTAAHTINTRTDLVLLGLLAEAKSVGIYQVAIQGAQAVILVVGAMNLIVAPYFSKFYIGGKIKELQRFVTLTSRAIFIMAVPIVVALYLLSGPLIEMIFGVAFSDAEPPLLILASAQLVVASFGALPILLAMTGRERDVAKSAGIAAVVNVGLNLVLIPYFGVHGAALATALSVTLFTLLMWRSALQYLKINSSAFRPRNEQE